MKCEYCGRRVPGRLVIQGAEFCRGCGAPLPEDDNKPDTRVLRMQYDDEIKSIINGTHPNIRRGDWQSIVSMKRAYAMRGLNDLY